MLWGNVEDESLLLTLQWMSEPPLLYSCILYIIIMYWFQIVSGMLINQLGQKEGKKKDLICCFCQFLWCENAYGLFWATNGITGSQNSVFNIQVHQLAPAHYCKWKNIVATEKIIFLTFVENFKFSFNMSSHNRD